MTTVLACFVNIVDPFHYFSLVKDKLNGFQKCELIVTDSLLIVYNYGVVGFIYVYYSLLVLTA